MYERVGFCWNVWVKFLRNKCWNFCFLVKLPKYLAIPAKIYLFKVNNRNTRRRYEKCSKLTIKTPERRRSLFDVFIVNFEQISQFLLVFLLLILNMYLFTADGRQLHWKLFSLINPDIDPDNPDLLLMLLLISWAHYLAFDEGDILNHKQILLENSCPW